MPVSGEGRYQERNACGRNDREKAYRVAQQVRLAARRKRGSSSKDNLLLVNGKRREEMEKELTRKVRSKSRDEQEETLQTWSSETQKVERRSWARERVRMEQEDSKSQRRAWEKIWEPRVLVPPPFLAAGNCAETSDWTSSSLHWSPQWRQPALSL